MVYKSAVVSAHRKSKSFRTTIPVEVCRELKIDAGDILDWTVEQKNSRKFIIIHKLE